MSNTEEETYTYLFKVVLIGDSGVGEYNELKLLILTVMLFTLLKLAFTCPNP